MKASEIKVGGFYLAKVSDRVVTVRVDEIEVGATYPYKVTNMTTHRTTQFRTAAKFRGAVADPTVTRSQAGGAAATATSAKAGQPTSVDDVKPTGGQHTSPPVTDCPPVPAAKSGLTAHLRSAQVPTDDSPHLIVEARAGTGKTTTLVAGVNLLLGVDVTPLIPSPQQRAVWDAILLSKGKARTVGFVAFNKSIADELRTRVPAGCDAMTMHSMGFKALNRAYRGLKVSEYKVNDIIGELMGGNPRDLQRERPVLVAAVRKLVGLCKMNLVGDTHPTAGVAQDDPDRVTELWWGEQLDQLAAHYEVDLDGCRREEVYGLVPRVLERCKDLTNGASIDYDDMIWLPVVLGLPVFRYDLLLVDEAQDLNRCQQALAKTAGSRLVLCGDPRQAIYGFAGADADSLPRMGRELGATDRKCVILPLTVTRRCGKAIVTEANKIVADFQAFETNPDGVISRAEYPTKKTRTELPWEKTYAAKCAPGDMVLCRVNAPLVGQCFRFLKRGIKATIQGRDVGAGLVSTIKKSKASTVMDLVTWLGDWLAQETRKEQAKRNPSEARLIALQDRHDCLLCFTDGCTLVDEVIRKIESVFTDDKRAPGVRFSSIHRAKGLEAHRVFLLEPDGAGVPHPMASSKWQLEQEWNLRYVAITRAINELVFVS